MRVCERHASLTLGLSVQCCPARHVLSLRVLDQQLLLRTWVLIEFTFTDLFLRAARVKQMRFQDLPVFVWVLKVPFHKTRVNSSIRTCKPLEPMQTA